VVLRVSSGSRIAFAYGAVTHFGRPFQAASANEPICNSLQESQLPLDGPTTPRLQRLRPITQPRFGLLRFRSPLLTECSLLLEVLRCFSSLGVLVTVYEFNRASQGITPGGFPHSDISGSTLARNSPKHFAACHVLRRLLAPRHPPHALSSLTYAFTRLARCWPIRNVAVASESPRRNRCFHSSIDKLARPSTGRSAMNPLTDGRDEVTRSGQKTDQMWGLSQRREESRRWVSPREPEYDITPSRAGQGDPGAADLSPADRQNSTCVRLWEALPHVAVLADGHAARLGPVGQAVRVGPRLDGGDDLTGVGIDDRDGPVVAVGRP
jgi:hypothetical protein